MDLETVGIFQMSGDAVSLKFKKECQKDILKQCLYVTFENRDALSIFFVLNELLH